MQQRGGQCKPAPARKQTVMCPLREVKCPCARTHAPVRMQQQGEQYESDLHKGRSCSAHSMSSGVCARCPKKPNIIPKSCTGGCMELSPCSSKENEEPRAAECSANALASPPLAPRRGPTGHGGGPAACGNPDRAAEELGPPCDAPAQPLARKSAQRSLVFGGRGSAEKQVGPCGETCLPRCRFWCSASASPGSAWRCVSADAVQKTSCACTGKALAGSLEVM